ncbi:MAG: hypothetical protein ACHQLQ_03270 [Candidatus Acidiferrales bacterium]
MDSSTSKKHRAVCPDRLVLEVNLFDWAYRRYRPDAEDASLGAAQRDTVDTEKLQKAVAQEFAANRKQQERKATANKKVAA